MSALKNVNMKKTDIKISTMKAVIDESFQEDGFWDVYTELWENCLHKSVFQAPCFLRHLADTCRNKIAVFKYYSPEGQLRGAVFFRKERMGYNLLSDIKSDHNFFVLHRDCSEDEIKTFFALFFREVKMKNWALTLNNLAEWASYYQVFLEAGKQSNLFWLDTHYSICPVLERETPELLTANIEQSREHRIKTKKLIDEQHAVFEIFREEEDLDEWVSQFCRLHIERWKGTSTPSKYAEKSNRVFLKECLKAWIKDGVLIRFSIKKGEERIAFVIGLLEGNALIHHSTSYDAQYYKISPGKVLTYKIIQWMRKTGLNKLDFGEGGEDYKFMYTNTVYPLGRVFVSAKSNLTFILNAQLKKFKRSQLQNNPKLRKLYHEAIWPVGQKVKSMVLPFLPLDFF